MSNAVAVSPRLETILSKVKNPTFVDDNTWLAECPAHNDGRVFRLMIVEYDADTVQIDCLGGCTRPQVLEKLGLPPELSVAYCETGARPLVQIPPAPMSPTPEIDALRSDLTKWLSIPSEDAEIIDFCMAVYKSNEIPGDPLWGIVIDASGAGKTELLRAFRKRPDAYFLSKLSEKTLVSGYRDPDNPKMDPSLLPQLNGKVLIIKDLAPLLSMRRESRNTIIADLRDAYDGFTDQGLGNLGRVGYESRFSLLAASTLAIERADTMDQELGERFIKFRARAESGVEKVRKAIENIGADATMRQDIEKAISCYLDSLPKAKEVSIPEPLREPLI